MFPSSSKFWKFWKVLTCCGISSRQTYGAVSAFTVRIHGWCTTEPLRPIEVAILKGVNVRRNRLLGQCPVLCQPHLEERLPLSGVGGGPAVVLRVALLLGQSLLRLQQPAGHRVQGGRQAGVQLHLVLTELQGNRERRSKGRRHVCSCLYGKRE